MASAGASGVESKLKDLKLSSGNATRSKLKGVKDERFSGQITHYRGIKYASISKRFAKPVPVDKWPGSQTDCTKFGPKCPTRDNDVRDLMQIPKHLPQNEREKQDELKCCNLNVTCPTNSSLEKLPVFMYIYGGSQMVAFGNAQQRLGDPGPIVAQSIELGKPIILVTIHFRLNIFAFGDGNGEVNLGLQDQKAALKWIKKNIHVFGGDPNNITVGGESAGAIQTHALLASGAEFERAILMSGSLYAQPPRPDKQCFGIVGLVEGNLQLLEFDKGNQSGEFGPEATVAGAKAETLVQTFEDLGIRSIWMWDEDHFKDWKNDARVFSKLKGLMIGDCQHEAVLWQDGISKMKAKKIAECFTTKQSGTEAGLKIAKAYGIDVIKEDHNVARQAALDYLADAIFSLWAQEITVHINKAGGKGYQYYYDQVNPFAKPEKARAHHAVDLLALFGGYDDDVSDETRRVARSLRTKWIDFINGEDPWRTDEVFLFGPNGMTGAVPREGNAAVHDLNTRRRQAQLAVLKEVGHDAMVEVWRNLISAMGTNLDD